MLINGQPMDVASLQADGASWLIRLHSRVGTFTNRRNDMTRKIDDERTHCKQGHNLAEVGTYSWTRRHGVGRGCKRCKQLHAKRRRNSLRNMAQGSPNFLQRQTAVAEILNLIDKKARCMMRFERDEIDRQILELQKKVQQ